MKTIIYSLLLILFLDACDKSEISLWNTKPSVWFTTPKDTLNFSFYSQPTDVTEYVLDLPISMAGEISDVDRNVSIKDLGALSPDSHYEIVSAMVPAGGLEGSLRIKIFKTANLDIASDTISFEICSSELFDLGLTPDYSINTIIVSNLLAKPTWWQNHLGYYSDKKMEIIYAYPGAFELFNGGNYNWYDDEIIVMIYKLNRYTKENNIKYNPDDESVITFAWGKI